MSCPAESGAQRQLAGVYAQYAPKSGGHVGGGPVPPALADSDLVMPVDALHVDLERHFDGVARLLRHPEWQVLPVEHYSPLSHVDTHARRRSYRDLCQE